MLSVSNTVPFYTFSQMIDLVQPDNFLIEYFTKMGKETPLMPSLGLSVEKTNGISKNLFIKFYIPNEYETTVELKSCSESPLILSEGVLKNRFKNLFTTSIFSISLKTGVNFVTLSLANDYIKRNNKQLSLLRITNKKSETNEILEFKLRAYGPNFTSRSPKKVRNPHIPLIKAPTAIPKLKEEIQSEESATTSPGNSVPSTIEFYDPASDQFLSEILENW